MRIVEFFGLPGSGKTTIARSLERILAESDIRVRSRARLDEGTAPMRHLRRMLLVAGQAPRAARLYLRALVYASRAGGPPATVKLCWNLCTVIALIVRHRARGDGVLILDQGLLQAVWSVRISAAAGAPDETWRSLFAAIGIGDMAFVLVLADVETARARLKLRGDVTSRMQRADWIDDSARWRQAERLIGDLAAVSGTGVAVHTDDGSAPEGAARAVSLALHLACPGRT